MRLLLDTNALVWYTHADPKLTTLPRTAIQDGTNEVFVSPASYWEIAIKVHLGKWILNRPYLDLMNAVLNVYGFQILPILPDPYSAAHRFAQSPSRSIRSSAYRSGTNRRALDRQF